MWRLEGRRAPTYLKNDFSAASRWLRVLGSFPLRCSRCFRNSRIAAAFQSSSRSAPMLIFALAGAVVDEQPQRRRVALDGARARAALDGEMFDEEPLDQSRQRGLVPSHSTVLPGRRPARRSILPVIRWLSSGTADRYQ